MCLIVISDCLTLNIENGSTNTTTSSHDSIVHVECKMGYVLFGEKEIRCTRGLWIPDVPSCHKGIVYWHIYGEHPLCLSSHL